MIFKYKGYDIFYEIEGKYSPSKDIIVILNGIMMSTASWAVFMPAFTKKNVLLRFDMVDQGQSSKATEPYTQELQVDLLEALLSHLGYKKVNLVGISYGASVALQFAIKYPHYVKKLVIANGVSKTSKWLKAIGHGWNEVGKSRNGLAYYNISIPYIYSPNFYSSNIEWMENRKQMLVPLFSDPVFLDSMERLTNSAETHDTVDQLHQLKCKTLIISGELDYLTPMFEQEFLHQNIKHSTHVIIPGCGHASMYEEPELFTQFVLGFINATHIPKII